MIHTYSAGSTWSSRWITGPAVATIVWSSAASSRPSSAPSIVKTFWAFVSWASAIDLLSWIGMRAALMPGMETPISEPAVGEPKVGELVHRITDDVKTIARGEVELARGELERSARTAAADGAGALFGGIVALIGVGMLCVAAAVALAPVIPPLWLRLVIMAAIYLVCGSMAAGLFGRRLRDAKPHLQLHTHT